MSFTRLQSRLALSAALLASTLTLTSAAPASANVGEAIIQRCTHGQSLGGFSQSAYTQALKQLSADAEEYTPCSSLIRAAKLAAAAGHSSANSGPGASNPVALAASPAEQRAITRVRAAPSGPVRVDGQIVQPGVVHANIASAVSSLPSPLLATLAFLLACLVLLVGNAVRNRFRGQRSD
jgi:hypothetical protein